METKSDTDKVVLTPQELFELQKELTLAVLASPNLTGRNVYVPKEVKEIAEYLLGTGDFKF